MPNVTSAAFGIPPLADQVGVALRRTLLDQLVVRHRMERDYRPVLRTHNAQVPHARWDGDPPLLQRSVGIAAEAVRDPLAPRPRGKIAATAERHHALMAVRM